MPTRLLEALFGGEENSPSLYERLRGKRTKDIELPNESGVVDPKLNYDEVGRKFQGGLSNLKAMRDARNAATKR